MTEEQDIIHKIHGSPHRGVIAVSGAGSQAVAWLLGVAGASGTLLEALMPYGRLSMIDFLGFEPGQFVSENTARNMARAAFRRAVELLEGDFPVVGLACTATIATDRAKRGEHRSYVATWDDAGCTGYSLCLAKGLRDREGEEEVVSRLVVHALAEVCGVAPDLDLGLGLGLTAGDSLEIRQSSHPGPVDSLVSGEADTVTAGIDGQLAADHPVRGPVLPGSFNPLHAGHQGLARAAAGILGAEVVFEISAINVDKPPLTGDQVRNRLAQFRGKATVVLTRAETYQKKARLFPGCTFIIGWDTAVRLVAPRYYEGDEPAMLSALAEIWAAGCRFLVAGREESGIFYTLDDVPIPQGFKPLFQGIPESVFRADISSTDLRSSG